MTISVKGEYALQALFDLASQPPGTPVKIGEIAKRQKIPQKFLELILAGLKQGGFVESRRGLRRAWADRHSRFVPNWEI
jgi:Rrf2 family protein